MEDDEKMLSKVLALVQTKVGAAALGAVLVAGGGTAVALTVTHGNISGLGANTASTETNQNEGNDGSKLHLEGVLLSYTAGNPGSISVQKEDKSSVDIIVNSDTRINGEDNSQHASGTPEANGDQHSSGTPEANGDQHSSGTPEASSDRAQSTKTPFSLSDLSKYVGHKVQVQADKDKDGKWVASKVTIEGSESDSGDQNSAEGEDLQGSVASVNSSASAFVLKTKSGSVIVVVNGSTHFSGSAHGLGDLKVGEFVDVRGAKQTDGSVLASQVASGESEGAQPSGTPHPEGTEAPEGTPHP